MSVSQHSIGIASPDPVFAESGVAWSFCGSFAHKLRAKCAQFTALKIVRSFVFKDFLASFPRFSYFLAVRRISLCWAISNRGHSPIGVCAKTCDLPQRSEFIFNARISTLNGVRWGVRFGSFRECLPLFSITYWLRSYYFLFVSVVCSPAGPGHSALWNGASRLRHLPTTMCP